VHGGNATLKGQTAISGKLVLKASVVLDIPLFSKSIDLPDVSVDIPESAKELDTAPAATPGLPDGTDGTCAAAPAPSTNAADDAGGNGPSNSGTDDGGVGPDGGPVGGNCAGLMPTGTPACDTCLGASCCGESTACDNNQDCKDFNACLSDCDVNNPADAGTCVNQCVADHPTGNAVYANVIRCAGDHCAQPCGR
jgi:hypothetical protein